uniref:Uncharacterized protein n=1 Tax=Verrucosispora sp. MS100047 TaxID=1410949 RepID=A0A097CSQ7_9ACTN|nr:hypothetical protein VASRM7_437 [Verrucosispora sp. MS100047]
MTSPKLASTSRRLSALFAWPTVPRARRGCDLVITPTYPTAPELTVGTGSGAT